MKNFGTKIGAAALAVLVSGALGACSASGSASSAAPASSAGSSGSSAKASKSIGIIEYAVNPSLDNCHTGFMKGLEESGYREGENLTVDFQNSQADPNNAKTIAKAMVAKKYDMVMGIATPAAMALYGAAKSADIPTVFTSVNDPVASGIVKSLEKPGVNCTGSSDVLPLEDQIKMIRAFLPNAKKIGVLHTTSEPNSTACLKKFQSIAPKYGFEVVEIGVTGSSDVEPAVKTLISKGVDCINNFTDNNVVNHLPGLLQAANEAKIPIFGSELEQVKDGCLASVSIDFVALGEETGKMAAKILDGTANPATTPVYTVDFGKPVYNDKVMRQLGISLPKDYSNAENVAQ
ncbi:ABC transporter substrate-binding protein [Clostridium sp. W14A]|uniref:ABC transporter substrate-binding protein n=1 Tax=Caproicibacter fermentans TaxID=2576756 RepID=A0A7G8TDG4_9FIRM|nr:ABC transporter substrate-binding protein [Caproicibacter fermentans]OCN00716.1 ABC transporter substrate-binding protein [Clostridium sp. W14A]QNK41655.1 ABC transporter substrate-binding protein [Caproicibacter fermentans]